MNRRKLGRKPRIRKKSTFFQEIYLKKKLTPQTDYAYLLPK